MSYTQESSQFLLDNLIVLIMSLDASSLKQLYRFKKYSMLLKMLQNIMISTINRVTIKVL